MIKPLLKKQLAEVFSWVFMDTRKKARRTGAGLVGFLALYAFLFLYLIVFFFMMARFLCEALVPLGLTWFYFTIMGLLSLFLGVFGSVFNTYASLYLAKDNDLLLSMPIPPRYILLVRLCGVYATGLFYELLVMLPTLVAWFIYGNVTVLGAIFALLIPLLLSFLVLTLSCLLGLLVATVSTHLKHKSLVITLLSLGFLGLYMWAYTTIMSSLSELLAMVGEIAEKVKGPLFPFYHMGRAAEGNVLSLLIFAGIVLGSFALTWLLLSHSFLSLATTNKGTAKRAYKRERTAQKSVGQALFTKELKRLVGSPTYLLNCALGALFLPIAGVALLIFRADIAPLLPLFGELLGGPDVIPLLLAAAACTMATMIDVTAPSISLEGKHLWILKTLPVTPWQVLSAKLKLHLAIALPPTLFAVICLLIALPPALPFFFLIPIATLLFTLLVALFGLFMNLKAPNLSWVNETVPVKQSMSVTVTLFGGWGVVMALGVLYFALRSILAPALYLALVCVLLAALCAALFWWLNKKGTAIFAVL